MTVNMMTDSLYLR